MSAPDSISPGPGSPMRTSVPLATRTPARAAVSPANIPPRLTAKLTTPAASPPRSAVPPFSIPAPTNASAPPAESSSDVDIGAMLTSPDGLLNYALQCGLQAIPALALGVIIDKILHKLQQRFDLGPLLMIIIQFIVIIIVLFVVEKYIASHYAADWQITTPGMFFYIFFFGVQFNLFENLKKLKKVVFDEK